MLLTKEEEDRLREAVRIDEKKKENFLIRIFHILSYKLWLVKMFPKDFRKALKEDSKKHKTEVR